MVNFFFVLPIIIMFICYVSKAAHHIYS